MATASVLGPGFRRVVLVGWTFYAARRYVGMGFLGESVCFVSRMNVSSFLCLRSLDLWGYVDERYCVVSPRLWILIGSLLETCEACEACCLLFIDAGHKFQVWQMG